MASQQDQSTMKQKETAGSSQQNKGEPAHAMKWGITPSGTSSTPKTVEDAPPDHPVHQMSKEQQEKLKAKGINPVLKAEMDDKVFKKGEGNGLWNKVAGTAMGGGWIK